MSFLEKVKGFLYKTFYGCHGMDQLNWGLFFVEFFLSIISGLFTNQIVHTVIQVINLALWVIILLRMFSKNNVKRNSENYKFICFWNPIKLKLAKFFRPIIQSIKAFISRVKDKDHTYFRCSCGTYLRVPKGQGKIKITCSKCNRQMIRKS